MNIETAYDRLVEFADDYLSAKATYEKLIPSLPPTKLELTLKAEVNNTSQVLFGAIEIYALSTGVPSDIVRQQVESKAKSLCGPY